MTCRVQDSAEGCILPDVPIAQASPGNGHTILRGSIPVNTDVDSGKTETVFSEAGMRFDCLAQMWWWGSRDHHSSPVWSDCGSWEPEEVDPMRYILASLVLTALVSVGGAMAEEKQQTNVAKPSPTKPLEVKIKSLPKMTVACVRHIGPYEKSDTAWKKLIAVAKKNGLIDKTTMFLGMYYDDPARTPADKLRCDACITVDKKTADRGDLTVKEAGGQEYAMATHVGPYKNLMATYKFIFEKGLPKLGRVYSSGPTVEIYKNDPKVTPPKELITEVYVPVKP